MTTIYDLERKLQRADRRQAGLYLFCNFIALMLISAYSALIMSPTVLTVLPEGGDSRKQMTAIFVLALFGCIVFTIYTASLFFRKKSRQLGVLMALGASRRRLAPGLFREVLSLSSLSALLGVAAGFPLVWLLWNAFSLMTESDEAALSIDPKWLFISLGFLLMVVLFSCATAWRYLRKTNIMDVVHEEHKNEPVKELGRWCGPVGLILILMGAFMGYNAESAYQALFSAYGPVWLNLLYLPALAGLYMVMLHAVVHGWFSRKRNPYRNIIARSMMKFQGKQTVNNMLVSAVLIAGAAFAAFYLPTLSASQIIDTGNRPYDYYFHYPEGAEAPGRQETEEMAEAGGVSIEDWTSGDYIILAMDGYAEVEGKNNSFDVEYRELLSSGKFISESSFERMTGIKAHVDRGEYLAICGDEGTGTYYLNSGSEKLTNMTTRGTADVKFKDYLGYSLLFSEAGFYIMDDRDYESIASGLSPQWMGHITMFNAGGEDSYSFARELYESLIAGMCPEYAYSTYYDPVAVISAEERGDESPDSRYFTVDYSQPDSSDFRMNWEYMPKFRIMDSSDYLRTFAVFLMTFLFISVICMVAALIIFHTRCQTIALNNRYVFDGLRRLGASPAFLSKEVKSQCRRVFTVPSVSGLAIMFLLYVMLQYANDGALTFSEIIALLICLGISCLTAAVIYLVYRATVKTVKRQLDIR